MKKTMFALAALGALASGSAFAQQAGDWVVGAGWFHLSPQDSSKPLTVTAPVQSVLAGSGASVKDSDTLGFNRRLLPRQPLGCGRRAGRSAEVQARRHRHAGRVGELGEARQWSPTILGKYYFNEGNDAFRPFVGLGATYVWYSDVKLTNDLQSALAASCASRRSRRSNTTAKLDSSFAPVLNAGIAYQFDKHWGLSFSVSYIPLKTKAKLTTTSVNGLPVATSEASLKLNPIVTYLAATYRF
jgi:outer membrane protein